MRKPANGLRINDRWWQKNFYSDIFQGDDFVSWLLASFTDINTRDAAVEWGRKLFDQGLIGEFIGMAIKITTVSTDTGRYC